MEPLQEAGSNTDGTWSWSLTSNQWRRKEWVELYLYPRTCLMACTRASFTTQHRCITVLPIATVWTNVATACSPSRLDKRVCWRFATVGSIEAKPDIAMQLDESKDWGFDGNCECACVCGTFTKWAPRRASCCLETFQKANAIPTKSGFRPYRHCGLLLETKWNHLCLPVVNTTRPKAFLQIQAPSQNSMYQKGERKQDPYSKPAKIRRHRIKCQRRSDQTPVTVEPWC
jgi:hypothetical protein